MAEIFRRKLKKPGSGKSGIGPPKKKDKTKSGHKIDLTDEEREYAILSDISYKTTVGLKKKELKKNNLERYKIDPKHTNKNTVTLHDKDSNKTVISFRGTSTSDLEHDLTTDLAIATGTENISDRFKRSEKILLNAMEEYGRDNITLVAHSLGGTIALNLGKKHDLEVHAFNPGSSISSIRRGITGAVLGDDTKNKRVIYKTADDPISLFSKFQGDNTTVKEFNVDSINPHSLDNFL